MCIMDILHFAVSSLQHPTHVSHHGCKFFNSIFFSSFKKHNWLALQRNTHIHTISTPIHNTLEYMRKKQKWSCIKKRCSNAITQNHYQFNQNNWGLRSNEYTGDVFLGSASGQLLQNDDWLETQTFRNHFVNENNGNIQVGLQLWI